MSSSAVAPREPGTARRLVPNGRIEAQERSVNVIAERFEPLAVVAYAL